MHKELNGLNKLNQLSGRMENLSEIEDDEVLWGQYPIGG
jgi:hypothetical protein